MNKYLKATTILDYNSTTVEKFYDKIKKFDGIEFLQRAHELISTSIFPVYTIKDLQPVSVTLQKVQGSCSQRMALLEALARKKGIPTSVKGIFLKGDFWFSRFKLTKIFIPGKILIAWSRFFFNNEWIEFDELYKSTEDFAGESNPKFTNDAETMFEAIKEKFVDLQGKTKKCGVVCTGENPDLSEYFISETEVFNSRDELFERYGTLQNTFTGKVFEIIYGGRKSA